MGKTLISQKLIEKYHYPALSLDHLKMGFIRTEMTTLTTEDDYEMRYFLWPFAAEMIKTAIENEQNMIVEGCYIPREWRESFSEEYLAHIRCIFIVMSENYIRENMDRIQSYENVIEHRLPDELDMERLISCSRNFKNDCLEENIEYLEITDKYDIDVIMNEIIRKLRL